MKNALYTGMLVFSIIAWAFTAEAAIKVVSVDGTVAYKEGQAWTPLRSGMNLKEGTKVSSSARSFAVIDIDGNTVTVQPLTMIVIHTAKSSSDGVNTGIGLKRGSLKASVNREKRVKTVFKITTPIATSSVRGTDQITSHGPMRGTHIIPIGPHSVIEGRNNNGSTRTVRGNQEFHQQGNQPNPENILSDAQRNAVANIFSKNLTDNEGTNLQNNGTDIVDNDNSTVNTLGNITGENLVNPKTKVKINVNWK